MIHHDSTAVSAAKLHVLHLCDAFDHAQSDTLTTILEQYTAPKYLWRGMHPFNEQQSASDVVQVFWKPLHHAFTALQRRVDIFFAAHNGLPSHNAETADIDSSTYDNAVWTCQMGHFMGLMDRPWLDIPPTRRMTFIRFAEFHRILDGVIQESALFIDLIGVMRQAGQYPLPPGTGASFIYPGPATSDGILHSLRPPEEGVATMALMNSMITDLSQANEVAMQSGDNRVPRKVLAKSWDEKMIWYGPEGIGATYTIDRYQQQHQYPFRFNLSGKVFNGHVARFAEGHYGCFFGWPNLTNTAKGGFMGLTASGIAADMRVTDVFRRRGDKLLENWVIVDLPHWLSMQGLDVLARMRQLLGLEEL